MIWKSCQNRSERMGIVHESLYEILNDDMNELGKLRWWQFRKRRRLLDWIIFNCGMLLLKDKE